MLLLAKVICYAKSFMPPDTVLTSKPIPDSVDECVEWDTKMRTLGVEVQDSMMNFIAKHHPDTHRARKPYAQGLMKWLQKIKVEHYPVTNVIDTTITSQLRSNCWYFAHIFEFK